MRKATVAVGGLILVALMARVGSAALLPVDGGILQVFEMAVTVPVPTPSQTPATAGCTYTFGYWKNHPELWPVDHLTLGGVSHTAADALAILQRAPQGDATYCLAHQLIAAKLNQLNGADSAAISATVEAADAWLAQFPLGSDPANPDRKAGVRLAEDLDDYNSGAIGPGHCSDDAAVDEPVCPVCTPTPSVSPTPTTATTPTPTPTPTPSLAPSESPTPAETAVEPLPTSTPEPGATAMLTATAEPSPPQETATPSATLEPPTATITAEPAPPEVTVAP